MLYIPLAEHEKQALLALARSEDRDPRSQAARFVREGLVRAGALPITVTDYHDVQNERDLVAGQPAPATL